MCGPTAEAVGEESGGGVALVLRGMMLDTGAWLLEAQGDLRILACGEEVGEERDTIPVVIPRDAFALRFGEHP